MDQAAGGLGMIYLIGIVILIFWPFIVLVQLGQIWSRTAESAYYLRKIEGHLAEVAKERKAAASRLAASMASTKGGTT